MIKKLATVSLTTAALLAVHPAFASAPSGNFDVSAGLAASTVQTTTFSGGNASTSNTDVTGTALGAEYLFHLGSRLSVGPSLLAWSLPSANGFPATSATAVGAAASYVVSPGGSLRLVLGNEFRFGGTQNFGGPGKGTFGIVELVVPQKDKVESFAYFGIGYRFH